jgi:hypothetical protein
VLALPYCGVCDRRAADRTITWTTRSFSSRRYAPFRRLADALTLLAEPPGSAGAPGRRRARAAARGDDSAITITPLEANTSQSSSGYDVFLEFFGMADRPIVEVPEAPGCDEAVG